MTKKSSGQGMWKYVVTAIVCIALATVGIIIGIHVVSNSQKNSSLDSIYTEDSEQLISPASYDELYSSLKKSVLKNNRYTDSIDDDMMYDAGASAKDGSVSTAAFSDTNIRTENVYESDIVKTDGRYIYTVSADNGSLVVIDSKDSPKIIYSSSIADATYDRIEELFINGSNLHLIISGSKFNDSYFINKTFLRTYDISNPESPVMTHEYEQDGSYVTSRISDNVFHLISDYSLSYTEFKNDMPYYPSFNSEPVQPEDIVYGRNISEIHYYCMSSIDLKEPGTAISAAALLNDYCNVYAGGDMFYFTSTEYVSEKKRSYDRTNIMSFSYTSSGIFPDLTACVDGSLNDSFSIDEYNGYLRMVLHIWEYTGVKTDISFWQRLFNPDAGYSYQSSSYNHLVIMDKDLQIISTIGSLAADEDIKSARFYEDSLYFVTYEDTDPLYAVNISDPYNPVITDGIKISGFSNYLHFWNDGMLLGIGYETDEYGRTLGFKVSMFDVSDPSNLKEADRIVISGSVYSIASDYGYKQILVSPEKNLIGFAAETYKNNVQSADYYIFSYDEKNGFNELCCEGIYSYDDEIILYSDDEVNNEKLNETQEASNIDSYYNLLSIENIRGLYIGDDFYIVHPGNIVKKINLKSYKLEHTLNLHE